MKFAAAFIALCCVGQCSAQSLNPNGAYPKFGVGPTGITATIEKGLKVTVAAVQLSEPAGQTDLKPGDVLLSVNGQSLSENDPRVTLGTAIGVVEAGDGLLTFQVQRGSDERNVTLRLPVVGAYSASWPENCKKSNAIVEQTVRYAVKAQQPDGSYQFGAGRPVRDDVRGCLTSLFLLSVGDDELIPYVRRHVRPLAERAETRRNAGGHVNWQLGYQGILLSEYYLRTGDAEVLPGLQELCNWCVDNQAAGGWSHGAPVGPGYVQSGLMNHAGLPVMITLIIAQECGIKVDTAAYARAIRLIYRMAGHGCVAYGDHRSELWWSNTNGRNAMTACGFSLLDHIPCFREASEHLATLVTDSYYQPEFGHTGGGFNIIWRGMASMHVPEHRRANFQRQNQELAWYYDLCRQPGGGFSMPATPPNNPRYTGLEWATGAIGLTYAAPRRGLRITGAPRTKFSRQAPAPDFDWGTPEDRTFLSTADAEGFRESESPKEIYHLLLKTRKSEATLQFCATHLRHYSPLVRTWAARLLGERNRPEALAILANAAMDKDPRVRRAAFDGVSGYDNWRRPMAGTTAAEDVSRHFLPAILKTLNSSGSAWWEIDGALFALGRCRPQDIRKQVPLILKYSKHEDWYLREAAFWALIGLHKSITPDEFQMLTQIYADSRHVYARSSYDAGFKTILKSDRVAFSRAVTGRAIRDLGPTTHTPNVMLGYGTGGIHEAAHRTMMILKHFQPDVYEHMVGDFVTYLQSWEPYYQHSVWLISGSKWQPGLLKVLEGLGEQGQPIVVELKKILERYDRFDRKRIGNGAKDLREQIRSAVAAWEKNYGGA